MEDWRPWSSFLGRHNEYYAMSEYTPVTATNPCGEEPLPLLEAVI